MMRVETTPLS